MMHTKTFFGLSAIAALMLSTSAYAAPLVTLTDSYDDWVTQVGPAFNNTVTLGPEYAELSTVNLDGGGSFSATDNYTGLSVGSVTTVGNWGSWSGNYKGDILYSGDNSNFITLSFSGLSAFGFEAQPLSTDTTYLVTTTLSSGDTITDSVSGNGGAQFFGFYGGPIASLTISTEDNAFAFGNFVSTPGVSTVPLPGALLSSD